MEGTKVGEKITCNIKTLSYLCIATDFLNSKALHRVDIGDNLFWLFENCCKFPVLSGEGLFVFIMAKKFYKKEELVFQKHPTIHNFKDISGAKFGKLVVLGYAGHNTSGRASWYCECECKRVVAVWALSLSNGNTSSCGCALSGNRLKHGHALSGKPRSATYYTWANMLTRCFNPKSEDYRNYGGRGITVCSEWRLDFRSFLGYMGDKPRGMTIERIDNDGNYQPGNVRWATKKEQANNTRSNRWITCNGKTKNISQWAKDMNVDVALLHNRIHKGWSDERTVTTPIIKYSKKS